MELALRDNAASEKIRQNRAREFMAAFSELCGQHGMHLSCTTTMRLRDTETGEIAARFITWVDGAYEWEVE